MGRMKKRKAESGKRERRGDPCGRPGARRTDCHDQRSRWSRNDGLFARGTVGRRDTWVPPYNNAFCRAVPACPAGDVGKPGRADVGIGPYEKGCRGGRPCPPGSVCSLWCVGEGLSCPPSCQPIPGHCRTRQSGHFLETGSLHPPLAALRRFPLPRATARVAPTDGNKERGKAGRRGRRPLRTGTRSAPVIGRGRTPPLRMAGGCGGACSYGVDRVPVGGNDETSAAVMRLGSSI